MKRILSFLLVLLAIGASIAASIARAGQATVIWISIDGLRNDYVQRAQAPTLMRLEKEGAYTNRERAIFPSLTFPNQINRQLFVAAQRSN
jgi:predicted AlkP superfamily pyrophosphatase or phosphodiesterase